MVGVILHYTYDAVTASKGQDGPLHHECSLTATPRYGLSRCEKGGGETRLREVDPRGDNFIVGNCQLDGRDEKINMFRTEGRFMVPHGTHHPSQQDEAHAGGALALERSPGHL